jgi:hydroxyethylthiazole kinase-like uncharacterized protein yjeF
MRGAYSTQQIVAAEQQLMATLPGGALMQRAAAGLGAQAAGLLGQVYGANVVVLAGAGNNGGDALYAGAALARRGARVTVLGLAPTLHPDASRALRAAGGGIADVLPRGLRADLILDGMLGIGGRPGLGGTARELAALTAAAREAGALVVAVDIPSGVDADTGWAPDDETGPVMADVTVTFGALKPGLLVGPGRTAAGEVRLVDIGLGPVLPEPQVRVLEAADVAALLPVPGPGDDKYTRGVVGVVAGSKLYGGAAVLATGAALRGGAGLVRYAGTAREAVRAAHPEVIVDTGDGRPTEAGRVQAWAAGPGMGTDDAAFAMLTDLLRSDVPLVVDADAITLIARAPAILRGRGPDTVLTPHDREFARIFGEVGADRIGAARRAALDVGATVLLKGDATAVAGPDGRVYVNPTGTPWLATGGSGDVLTGLIGALLAAGLRGPEAAAVGAYVHGLAGQIAAANGPPTARDVLAALRPAIASITSGRLAGPARRV